LTESASSVVSGELTGSMLEESLKDSKALLSARFVVTCGGKSAYDRALAVETTWESNFMGAIAIPRAFDNYASLYQRLVEKLLSDKDFANACPAAD
jgi:hypothetical protein